MANILYFGPAIMLLAFLGVPVAWLIQRQGTGMVLCLAIAFALGINNESRKLISFFPFVVLFVVQAAGPYVEALRDWPARGRHELTSET